MSRSPSSAAPAGSANVQFRVRTAGQWWLLFAGLLTFALVLQFHAGEPVDAATAVQIDTGGEHTCAVTSTGAVRCWGWDIIGQSSVPADLGTATMVTAGLMHSCAVLTTQAVRCWGSEEDDRLVVPDGLGIVTQIDAGSEHTCALTSTAAVRCWGSNFDEQSAVPDGLDPIVQVSTGSFHTCVVISGGAVRCWGYNVEGQASVPGGLGPVTQVSSARGHTCALLTTRVVQCWGDDEYGKRTVPSEIQGLVSQVSAGFGHTCAVLTSGAVRCWGWDAFGQTTVPDNLGSATYVAAGDAHTCALLTTGAVRCWGDDSNNAIKVPFDLASDLITPGTSILTSPSAQTNSSSATFTFTGSDDVTPVASLTFKCRLDMASFTACTSPRQYGGLAQGSHTFEVVAVDIAGNVDQSPASFTWNVDLTPPSPPSIMQQPANPTNLQTATFTFSSTEQGVSFLCTLDAAAAAACSGSQTYTGLNPGSHTVKVQAVDAAGNVSAASTVTWLIDTTAPSLTATTTPAQPNAAGWFTTAVSVALTASDPQPNGGPVTVEYRLHGGGWTSYSGAVQVSGEGSHTFEARATDAAGNQTTLSRTFSIDTTAPDARITIDPTTREPRVVGVQTGQNGSDLANTESVTPTTCSSQRAGKVCLYRVSDVAGNSLTLTLLITQQAGRVQVQVQRVQLSGKPASTPLSNSLVLEYAPQSGTPTSTTQTLSVTELGPPAISRQIRATWSSASDVTTISFVSPAAPPLTCAGQQVALAFLVVNGVLRAETSACPTG